MNCTTRLEMSRVVLVLTLLLSPVGVANGQTGGPNTMSYQGTLADAAGNPVADGNYSLTFRIYDVASGGTALWSQTHATVPVSGGGFGVLLGAGIGIALPFDKPYWIGISIGGGAELAPRTPLSGSPYAMSLRMPYAHTASMPGTALLTLTNYGGRALSAAGEVRLGGGLSGNLVVASPGDTILAQLRGANAGGELSLIGRSGRKLIDLGAESSGGPQFSIYKDTGYPACAFDDFASYWYGSNGTVTLSPDIAGDKGVRLPNSTIADHEILDEPGLNSNMSQTTVSMDGTPAQSFNQRSGTMPDSGYVVVLSTFRINIAHTNGTSSNANFTHRVVQNGVEHVGNTSVVVIPSTAATGTYTQTVTLHDVFATLPGTLTTSLTGQEASGAFGVYHRRTTTIFLPSDYGIVEESVPQALDSGDDSPPRRTGDLRLDPAEVAREKARHESKLAREVDTLRRELDELRRRLDADRPELTAGGSR